MLQIAGRVSRNGEYPDAQVWSFTLQTSIDVLNRYLREGVAIIPTLSTRALRDELRENDAKLRKADRLLSRELDGAFQAVAKAFVVIDEDTVLLVPDAELAEQIRSGHANWQALQRRTVSIPRWRTLALRLEAIAPDLYRWDRGYDAFLGYMAGVLASAKR